MEKGRPVHPLVLSPANNQFMIVLPVTPRRWICSSLPVFFCEMLGSLRAKSVFPVVLAVITVAVAGEAAANDLLVLSQVILSLQLPFTIVPLLKFTGAENIMGAEFVTRGATLVITWIVAAIVLPLLALLIVFRNALSEWTSSLWDDVRDDAGTGIIEPD